jgi:hypothetical protein
VSGAEFVMNVDGIFNMLSDELYGKDKTEGVKSWLMMIQSDNGSKKRIASDLGS